MIRSSQSPALSGRTEASAKKYGSTITTMTVATVAALRRTMVPMARASTEANAARIAVPTITRASVAAETGKA